MKERVKMPYVLIIVSLLASSWISSARADDCTKAQTQTEMNGCADAGIKSTDAELNQVYRDIIARLKGSDETKQLLIASQRAWLLFRDAECAFATNAAKDGSLYHTLVQNCRSSMTQDRIKGLNAYLNCQEGDMSCPVPK
jgi:uncharacterized protein YecT (DUF1311 family)